MPAGQSLRAVPSATPPGRSPGNALRAAAAAAMDALSRAGPRRARDHLGAQCTGARAPAVPWARFSAWLECVCVVTFDLELGQALEVSPAGRGGGNEELSGGGRWAGAWGAVASLCT